MICHPNVLHSCDLFAKKNHIGAPLRNFCSLCLELNALEKFVSTSFKDCGIHFQPSLKSIQTMQYLFFSHLDADFAVSKL